MRDLGAMSDFADDMRSARNAVRKAKERLEGAYKSMGPSNPYLLPVSYILEDLEKAHERLEEIAGPGYDCLPVPEDKARKGASAKLPKKRKPEEPGEDEYRILEEESE